MIAIIVFSFILAGMIVGGLLNRFSAYPKSEDALGGGLLGLLIGGIACGVLETYFNVPLS